ncbi:hypothetical protein JCM1841_007012 [Sporobolomyces salmonicolor]
MPTPNYAPASSPLTLPDPRPAPGASPVRSPSAASFSSGITLRPAPPPASTQEAPTTPHPLPTDARIEEEVETLRLVVRQNRERVRQAAWREVQGRESLRRRVEERIRSDHPGLAEEQVGRRTEGAMQGVGMSVGTLELDSYGGRVAAETPFAELAHLIDDAANERRAAMGGEALVRENTWTTLGRSTDEYSTFELGAEGDGAENQPLAGGAGEGVGVGEAELGGLAGEGAKISMGMRLRLNWKDYLDGDSDSTDSTATSS